MLGDEVSASLWLLNAMSLSSTFLLSHGKIGVGRIVGAFASLCWCLFGVVTQEYSFLAANILYGAMYIHAIWLHNNRDKSNLAKNNQFQQRCEEI